MPTAFKPGTRLYGRACTTELMIIRAPADAVEITIGGLPSATSAADRDGGSIAEGHGGGSLMGKRYVDAAGTVELLCTKAGEGAGAVNGELLEVKDAKPLPSSD